jgi:hypothetical protein
MARIRSIKPKFWDDIKIGRLSRDARLLYIGLWSFSDDIGVVIGDSIWLKSKVFPYDQIQVQQFEKWIKELVINGFICLLSYNEERFIYLPNFTRHQVINRPNTEDLNIPKELIDRAKKDIHSFLTEQSLNNHGTIMEQSVLIIGEGKGIRDIPPIIPPGDDEESSGNEAIDYNALMDTFNKMFDGKLPKVSSMTDKRKKSIKARVAEYDKQAIMDVFNNILQSPFLLGRNDRNWRCDFDWIFRPTNFTKILECNYNGTRISKNQQDSEQRKRDSVLAVATTVREAAAKKRKELEAEGIIGQIP